MGVELLARDSGEHLLLAAVCRLGAAAARAALLELALASRRLARGGLADAECKYAGLPPPPQQGCAAPRHGADPLYTGAVVPSGCRQVGVVLMELEDVLHLMLGV